MAQLQRALRPFTVTAPPDVLQYTQHQQRRISEPAGSVSRPHWLKQMDPFILLPLYIYPTAESWRPLFEAIERYPDLAFMVVVNPASGPGSTPLPDANYQEQVGRLCGYANVKVLGYVTVNYGKRPKVEVESELRSYSRWTHEANQRGIHHSLRIDGVFYDEAPSSMESVLWMRDVCTAARLILRTGEQDDSAEAIVIFNPGVVVPEEYYHNANPSYIVAFENHAVQWPTLSSQIDSIYGHWRYKTVIIGHTATNKDEQLKLAKEVTEKNFTGQFITTTPGYTEWCPHWEDWVKEVDDARQEVQAHKQAK